MLQVPATILLIDDDAFPLAVLAEAFTGSGFQVLTATNGNQGSRHTPTIGRQWLFAI